MTTAKRYLLWENGAPCQNGNTPADIPDFTLYMPNNYNPTSRHGFVIVLPGGGYHFKADEEGEPIAKWLCGHGIPAAVVQYRVKPYKYPVPAEDARRAVRFARSHADEWGINPQKIALLGFSAGGHCAATAAVLPASEWLRDDDPIDQFSSKPDALVLCYPVITLGPKRHDGSLKCLLADANGTVDPKLQEFLSLENRVTPDTPPTFIWTTFNDNLVPVENTLLFANALAEQKIPFELHIFPDGYHGLKLAPNHPVVRQWPPLCIKWLEEAGF